MGAVVALPRFSPRSVVDDFYWAYFAVLFLSSVLDLGFERLAAPVVARSRGTSTSLAASPLMAARLCSVPLTAVALWLLYIVVHVQLPVAAWWGSLGWVVAAQIETLSFSLLRAREHSQPESLITPFTRGLQAVVLLLMASAGAGVTGLVVAMAAVEAVATGIVTVIVGREWRVSTRDVAALPWRLLGLYTGVELIAITYLRVDTLLAGVLLGASIGATYSLVYRVVDGVVGLATPSLLLLFPRATDLVTEGRGVRELRSQAAHFVPPVALALAGATMTGVGPLAAIVPRIDEGAPALRLLLVSVPLFLLSTTEMHLRSAEGRNAEVVTIGATVLGINVVANVVLIPRYELIGAAVALMIAELIQITVLTFTSYLRGEGLVRASVVQTLGCAVLLAIAIAANNGADVLGTAAAIIVTVGAGAVFARRVVKMRVTS